MLPLACLASLTALSPACRHQHIHPAHSCPLCPRSELSNMGIQATLPVKLRQLNKLKTLKLDGNK